MIYFKISLLRLVLMTIFNEHQPIIVLVVYVYDSREKIYNDYDKTYTLLSIALNSMKNGLRYVYL